jgi:hypothetical protein
VSVQQLDHAALAAIQRAAQRRFTLDVACFQVCTSREQHRADGNIVAARRSV